MAIKINFKKNLSNKTSANLVLFADEKFSISHIKRYLTVAEFSYISDLLKISDLKKKLLVFELRNKKKIVLVSTTKNLKTSDIENLGAEFFDRVNYGKNSEYNINADSSISKNKIFIGHFLHGLKLKSYEFNKYKTKKETRTITLNVIENKNKLSIKDQQKFKAIEEGTFFARDLVSEPGNVLHPDEYAKRINLLKKIGLKINI